MKGVLRDPAWVYEQRRVSSDVTEVLRVLFGREQSICQEIKTFFAVAQRASGAYELYKISFC